MSIYLLLYYYYVHVNTVHTMYRTFYKDIRFNTVTLFYTELFYVSFYFILLSLDLYIFLYKV